MTKIRNKILLAFLVTILPVFCISGTLLLSTTKALYESSTSKMVGQVSQLSGQVTSFLEEVESDLYALRDLSSLSSFLTASTPQENAHWRQRVEQDFLQFSEHKKKYHQVRFIDQVGQERVRVNRTSIDSASQLVSQEKMQNKRGRFYFDATSALKPGELFVSPLDLNQENGQLEQPLRPVIRYASPLFDQAGELQGIILVNVLAEQFLTFLRSAATVGEVLVYIDNDGFYYLHPDAKKAWGNGSDLSTGENFQTDYPLIAKQVMVTDTGTIIKNEDHIVAVAPVILQHQRQAEKLGMIVKIVPNSKAFGSINSMRDLFIGAGVVALLLSAVIVLYLANSITRPLIQLTEAANEMSRGKISKPIVVSSKDEIKELAESVERLRKSINILIGRLRRK